MPKTTSFTEEELVRGCIQNSRLHQEHFYRKFFPTMMRMVVRYTSDQDQAVEILNNGFLRVFKKLHTFSFAGSLEGWVRRLVFHAVSDYFRKNSKDLRFLVFEERDEKISSGALDKLYLEDLLKLVRKLPHATQRVFQLYAVEGYTHVEIGKQLGISEGTSKWHLNAARKKLKQLIQENHTSSRYYAG